MNCTNEKRKEDDLPCELDIINVTDHNVGPENKVQVFISGCFDGKSRVGPNVAYYLVDFLASNFNKDPYITYILSNREIIITPMTNAIGFYEDSSREETVKASGATTGRQPGHDFPYN